MKLREGDRVQLIVDCYHPTRKGSRGVVVAAIPYESESKTYALVQWDRLGDPVWASTSQIMKLSALDMIVESLKRG